ncbi:MAG: fumarylacetoacetase [Flavobacteriales bacterium]|nr:fumarylacetoacetase [Flavobacteriales bacterium]
MDIRANDPELQSWVPVSSESDFPIQNLPFGIFSTGGDAPRPGVAIGDQVVDLQVCALLGLFDTLEMTRECFSAPTLNPLMKYGKSGSRALRNRISELLSTGNEELRPHADQALHSQEDVQMHMPVEVGDYTDFYSSRDHATNVGTMFRDPDNALLPNWLHIPVGYHGRASSIVVSGVPIHRPKGQMKPPEGPPVFGPCKLLDFELEMAFITYDGKPMGHSISTTEASDYIFGMVIFNDWSARDIQKWEYVPLGPFLAKNFASSISPWVVTLDALEPFRVAGEEQEPEVLPYLKYEGKNNFDLPLEVSIRTASGTEKVVSRSNYRYMYWNMNQQLAHHTVNGCNIRCGDMMASGTISGPDPSSYGSMLELSWRGTKPIDMPDGSQRKFIQDGDTVVMRAHGQRDGYRIGFGSVETEVLPAK